MWKCVLGLYCGMMYRRKRYLLSLVGFSKRRRRELERRRCGAGQGLRVFQCGGMFLCLGVGDLDNRLREQLCVLRRQCLLCLRVPGDRGRRLGGRGCI